MRTDSTRIVSLSRRSRKREDIVSLLDSRKHRMSIEHLALCHVAMTGRGPQAIAARAECTEEELRSLIVGSSFVETVLLSSPFLDLYEEEAHVGEKRRSSPVEAGARAMNRSRLELESLRRLDGIAGGLR